MNERDATVPVPTYTLIPQILGDFERLDLGHPGGMGVVYKVLNRRLNAVRALKVLKQDMANRMPVREAFIREANFGAQLAAGPNILPVHSVGTIQGWDFIEMDWVEGPNLARFLSEQGRLDPWAALTLFAMILDALDYAHHAKIRYPDGSVKDGIIHRDIKPANILIDERTSRPLLSDFGIALAREVARDPQGGSTAGTINYLPPELIQGRPIDERSDIYQVGLVLYELLSGQRTFPGGAGEGVQGNIVNGYKKSAVRLEAIRLERRERKFDPQMVGIVERALELDPANRWQTAAEMRDAIRAYLLSRYKDHDPRQAFGKYYKDKKTPGLKPKKPVGKYVLGALLLLVLVAAGIWGGRRLYIGHLCSKFDEASDELGKQREVWDKQEWEAARTDAVDHEWQEIQRLGAARECGAARDRAIALTRQMLQEVEPLQRGADEARQQYEAELGVFRLQKWPNGLVGRMATADSAIRNEINSGVYAKIRDLCQSQLQVLKHYDSTKAEEFGRSAARKELRTNYYRNQFTGTPCGDSAAVLVALLSRLREEYTGRSRYQEGIDSLARIQVPRASWSCTRPDSGDTSLFPEARLSLKRVLARLSAFKNQPGWEQCTQSKQFSQCNIRAVEGYLDLAEELLNLRDLEGARMQTSSASQCLDLLDSECEGVQPCLAATKILREAESALTEFQSKSEWEKHAQSAKSPDCNVEAAQMHLDSATAFLGDKDCQGVTRNAKSALQCAEFLLREIQEWNVPPESAYVLGKTAYQTGRYPEAYERLKIVPPGHERYEPARMMMANALCYQGIYDNNTLDRYREAGPLCAGEDALCYTCKLQCFAALGWCDSVEIYYDMAIGTGKLRCDNSDKAVMYGNSLICKFRCVYNRFLDAKKRGAKDEQYNWGASVQECYDKFVSCFGGRSDWEKEEGELREKKKSGGL